MLVLPKPVKGSAKAEDEDGETFETTFKDVSGRPGFCLGEGGNWPWGACLLGGSVACTLGELCPQPRPRPCSLTGGDASKGRAARVLMEPLEPLKCD